jgi:16S rRNA (guanine527-N7)-methyltransferase
LEKPGIWLRTICRKNGLVVSDDQTKLMERYVDQLLGWNKKVNLISRQDEELVWQNHILHSISPLFKLKLKDSPTILDLGTGGGLPGIPLKILLPNSEIILIDATRKKIIAVDDMLAKLELQGIRALWGRAEELAREQSLVSHFDYIITRAVAPLNDLITWSKPFLRLSTTVLRTAENVYPPFPALIALKGGDLEEEIGKASRGEKIHSIEVVDLVFPGSEEMSSSGKKIVVVRF